MYKKLTIFFTALIIIVINFNIEAQPTAYAFDGAFFRYGTIDLNSGAFTSLNFLPQGNDKYPVSGDNDGINSQYTIMANFSLTGFYLYHLDFVSLTADSIAEVGPLAAGQSQIRALAHNTVNDVWYVISGNDFADASVLYTLNLSNGELTVVGNIQNANFPAAFAIDCFGNAYVVNIEFAGFSTAAVFYSLNLTTAAATQIGTDLGLPDVSFGSQDMDFNPVDSTLYWAGYWIAGFNEGGSFRLIDVNNGTSTEIGTYVQFETITGFSINANCVIPVELTSFSAKVINNSVSLDWSTATETNNSGFDIERKSANSNWQKIGFVTGSGTTTEKRNYSFTDNSLNSGSYSYRLKQIDYNGQFEYSNEVEVVINQPMEYSLDQNYPNPFNPSTTIEFTIPQASSVNLVVYNILGQEVRTLVNEFKEAGIYKMNFDAKELNSGMYIYKLEAASPTGLVFTQVRKMLMLK